MIGVESTYHPRYELPVTGSSREDAQLSPAARWLIASKVLSKVADTLIDPKTVLTWMLNGVGAPGWIVDALVPLRESGSMLPQVWLSRFVQAQENRSHVCVAAALGQGLMAGAMAAGAWFLGPAATGWLVLLALALFAGFRALSSIASKDVLAHAIPKGERGQVNGRASSFAGIVGAMMGIAAILGGQHTQSTAAYAGIVVAGALCFLGVALCFRMLRDTQVHAKSGHESAALRELWAHKDARRFVLSRALLTGTALVAPTFVNFGQQDHDSLSALASFVLASGVASGLSSARWGKLADRGGQKAMRWGGLICFVTAALALGLVLRPFSEPRHWLTWPILYFVFTIGYAGVRVGRKTYIVDIVEGNRRTALVATSNSLIAVVLILFGALGATLNAQSRTMGLVCYVVLIAAGCLSTWFLRSPFTKSDAKA